MRLSQRFERLNALAAINNAQTYLEIGVAKGNTFLQIDCETRVAVDPKFKFDFESHADERTHFHQVTSDHFFAHLADRYPPFDLIYLDGLHTAEQTLRDFCATVSLATSSTIWLIDDTRPTSYASSLRNPSDVRRVRHATGDESRQWYGDVYKTVFAIAEFFPQYSVSTFRGHGQTAVWRATRSDFAPHWDDLEAIARCDYHAFLEVADQLMHYATAERLIDRIRSSIRV